MGRTLDHAQRRDEPARRHRAPPQPQRQAVVAPDAAHPLLGLQQKAGNHAVVQRIRVTRAQAHGLSRQEALLLYMMAPHTRLTTVDAFLPLLQGRSAWTLGPALAGLLASFDANDFGRTLGEWFSIARLLPDRHADVSTFARECRRWTPTALAELVGHFASQPGGGNAESWCAVAEALSNDAAASAAFGRVGGWQSSTLQALCGQFRKGAAGRPAAGWAALAGALPDHVDEVAVFARLQGWTTDKLTPLVRSFASESAADATRWCAIVSELPDADITSLVAFCRVEKWTDPHLARLADLFHCDRGQQTAADWTAIASAHASLHDAELPVTKLARIAPWRPVELATMAQAGWPAAELADFAARAVAAPIPAVSLQALLAEKVFAASSRKLITARWQADTSGDFVGGALCAGAGATAFTGLLAAANFPAAAVALIDAGLKHDQVGKFVGKQLAEALPADALLGLITTARLPTTAKQWLAAGWPAADLGSFCAHLRLSDIAADKVPALMGTPDFAVRGRTVCSTAGWSPVAFATFTAAAHKAQMDGTMLVQQINATGMAAAGAALLPAWSAAELGCTVGFCRKVAGAPSAIQMVALLQQSHAGGFGHEHLRTAASAEVLGESGWAEVIRHQPQFSNPTSTGSGRVAAPQTFETAPDSGQFIQLVADVQHIERGHTYEHFWFTAENCERHEHSSMFAPLADVATLVAQTFSNSRVRALAVNRAMGVETLVIAIPGYRIGVVLSGGYNWHRRWVPLVCVRQFYPTGAIEIRKQALLAIWRWRGPIA